MSQPHTGLLLIDKPAGITSHDVIDRLRRITGERTIGHAGTLDPFATGLLLVAVGRETTKHLQEFVGLDKEYEASIRLGEASTTFDTEGVITPGPIVKTSYQAVSTAMQKLTGDILQIPPMHSAIKIGGKKLYDLARQGIEIDRPARPVTVYAFTIVDDGERRPNGPSLPMTIQTHIHCSSGTYIRALARDLGEAIGTAGYLTALRRTKIGTFEVAKARKLDQLSPQNWFDALQTRMLF